MLNDSNSFYDESLIRILQAPNEDVQDNRVCKAIADMTGRVVVVLTLFNDDRPITPETIYPTNGNKEDPCIYIGHIEDSHFVPIRGISSSGQHTPDSGSNISRTELNNTTRTDGTHDTGFNTSRAELNGTTETDGTHDSRFNTPTADLNDTTQTDGTHDSGSNISGTELNVNDTTETDVQLQQTTIQEPILDDTTPDLNSTQEIAQSLHVPTLTRDEISSYPNDIGSIFRPNMSSMEASSTAMSLNDQQRYNLLTNHFSPSQNYKFKPVFQNGCNRRCSRNFNTAYPWLVFSDCQNGVFCIHCALFAKNRSKLNQFVNSPFNNWYKFKEKVEIHAQRPYHRESVLASQAFNDKMTNPSSTLPHIINRELEQRVTTNRHILKHIIKALLFCAKQCIGLRGTIETFHMIPTVNPGNFIAFLRDRAEDDEILREHLLFPQKKNAKYVSPPSQNELISIIANFISEQLIQDILSAKFYTIMADEVTSHNQEFMPLCIRFVDKENNIREEFLEFLTIKRITGRKLADKVLDCLNQKQIPLNDMRGQCYDGAANMSSDRCGLQRCIREQAPLAPYTRCNSHALNLVIVHACKQTDVAHTLTKMKEVCLFYKYSPKRQGLLESIIMIEQSVSSTNKRKPLLDLCKTRWAERHYAYSHFYDSYVFVVESLEFISYGLHKDKYDLNLYDDPWDKNTKHDAVSLLNAITEFGFIIVFMIIYQGLSALAGISVGLQRKALDVYDAFSKVDLVKSSYNSLRTNIDGRFGVWFSQATRIAERVGVTPGMPRLAAQRRPGDGRSVYRPNADLAIDCGCTITLSSLPCIHHIEDYFRQNYAIPFIDHIITELELQFSDLSKKSALLLGLVPTVIKERDCDIAEIIAVYSEDLPSPVLVEEEYQRYKDGILQNVLDSDSVIPDSCATAIKNCDALLYPNIYTLLKLACTSPVTNAECERSASSLRRLHHYNRASMSLALIHIHYGFDHSYEKIINSFSKLHPRNMELENIIFQK